MAALLDEVLEAHGGLERWRSARTIQARVRSGGLLLRTRVPGNRFTDYRLTVDAHAPKTVMDPFPRDEERAVFDRGTSRIESRGGEVLASRRDPRSEFFGISGLRRNLRWDSLDSAYFAGYAMWNYLTTPYLLAGDEVEVREGGDWEEDGEPWRRLEASFRSDIDTHSRRQTFYFDAQGRLRRHDYVADVIGGWARVAHYCADHVQAGGLVFPTRRWVRPLRPGNRSLPFPTMVSLELTDLHVETE
jgi:hypothetical protein